MTTGKPSRRLSAVPSTLRIPLAARASGDAMFPQVAVRDAYRDATELPLSTYAGHDGLDVRTDLGGLNLSLVPKVFIECGNMRNASDAKNLEDPDFRQKIAVGIAQGLETFVRSQS